MFSHHGKLSRTTRSSLPTPRVKTWYVVTGSISLSLLLMLRWAGGGHRKWPGGGGSWGRGWVTQVFVGIDRVVTGGAPLSMRLGCLGLLIAILWAARRAMLERNAYRPGPVDVKDLVAATSGAQEPPVSDLTAQFRKQLSETNLYPPCALPAEAPAENFLDLLGDVDLEPGKLGTSLLHLSSRLRPKIAYRVSGVLRERSREPRFGVTVTVTSYAIRGSRMETVWGRTWDQAVGLAGYWVAAALIPVTRAGRNPPWRQWRGRELPADLFAAYQQAREFGSARRFDEALERYFCALEYDPTNLYLRTQIAGTQEKLGLYLDALETYHAALTLGLNGTWPGDDRLWRYPWPWYRFNCLRELWWRRGVLQARYRYAVVLGFFEITARQWCDRRGRSPLALSRAEIRSSLTPAFVDRYWPLVVLPFQNWRQNDVRARQESLRTTLQSGTERDVRQLFQRACVHEMCRLAQDYPIGRRIPGMVSGETLTRTALRINRDVWAPLRLAWACNRATGPRLAPRPWLRWRRSVYKRVEMVPWPATVDSLERPLKRARRSWRPGRRCEWQNYYNAACVYAVAMHGHRKGTRPRAELARKAVEELDEAVRSAESGFVTLKRSWLLSEDPDLELLRGEDRFVRFERETYPHETPDHHRSSNALQAEVAAYDRQLLAGVARLMEQTWHCRGGQTTVDIHAVVRWFEGEYTLWRCVHRVAMSRARNWPDRAKLLKSARETVDPALLAASGMCQGVPELDELLDSNAEWYLTRQSERPQKRVDRSIEDMDNCLRELRTKVAPNRRSSPTRCSRQCLFWARTIDASESRSVPKGEVRQVCTRYAAAWQAFGTLFGIDEPEPPTFEDKMAAFESSLSSLTPPPH